MNDDFWERFRAAARATESATFWLGQQRPADRLRALADAAEELDLSWDQYAARGAVAMVEERLTELFGTEGAAWFPSGTMAQQAALRVWCDRAGTRRVALPDLAHPLVHEQDGPRLLHGFHVEHLTTGPEVATAASLEAVPGLLAAVLVELPLRDAACRLPSWSELQELSAAARTRGVRLHADGARIWEAQPYWDRSFPEIAALVDSMYVSFYKGLGGLAGAALVGPADFLDETRQWRQRMGGTLFRSTPEAVAALVGLRDLLPRMAETLAWARELAAALRERGLVPEPTEPHTPTFVVHAPGQVDEVNERLLAWMGAERRELTGPWREGAEPGRVRTELAVTVTSLSHDPSEVAADIARVVLG